MPSLATRLRATNLGYDTVSFVHEGGPCLAVDPQVNRFFVLESDGVTSHRIDGFHPAYEASDVDEDTFATRVCIGDKVGIQGSEDYLEWKGSVTLYGTDNGTKWAEFSWEFPERAPKEAGIQVNSPIAGQIYVTLIKGGANAPYSTNLEDTTTTNDAVIQMDGQTCNSGATAGEYNALPGGDASWSAGETIVFDTDCTGTFASPSTAPLASQSEHSISVSVRGAVVFTGTVTVR